MSGRNREAWTVKIIRDSEGNPLGAAPFLTTEELKDMGAPLDGIELTCWVEDSQLNFE